MKATTAIHIKAENWKFLREVAYERALASGDRPSVSALVDELVDKFGHLLRDQQSPKVRAIR